MENIGYDREPHELTSDMRALGYWKPLRHIAILLLAFLGIGNSSGDEADFTAQQSLLAIHVLELTAGPREAGVKYPRCIDGHRAGPPEDVGGPSGYADFLEAWRDPLNDQHTDMRRWVGRKFDPERFDLDANNKAIARAIRRSKGSYRFRNET